MNKEYYLKAYNLLGKISNKAFLKRNFRRYELIKKLCDICIEGQHLGYIAAPAN